jgi:hypothetical protein
VTSCHDNRYHRDKSSHKINNHNHP